MSPGEFSKHRSIFIIFLDVISTAMANDKVVKKVEKEIKGKQDIT